MLINYLNGLERSLVNLCSPTVMDEEPPPTRGSREKCSHMCRLGRSSEWRNLMPIKRLFHTRRALSSAQIQTLVFYRLWKWLTARVACWWRVSTIIEIIHSYLSPVNLLLSNYNRGVTESAWKVVENFFFYESWQEIGGEKIVGDIE